MGSFDVFSFASTPRFRSDVPICPASLGPKRSKCQSLQRSCAIADVISVVRMTHSRY